MFDGQRPVNSILLSNVHFMLSFEFTLIFSILRVMVVYSSGFVLEVSIHSLLE